MYKLLVILFVITDNVNGSQKIPSYDPINLDKTNTILSDGLKSLCSEGPSSVPVPPHYNWLELQQKYDLFRKRMKTPFLFSNKEYPVQNTNMHHLSKRLLSGDLPKQIAISLKHSYH